MTLCRSVAERKCNNIFSHIMDDSTTQSQNDGVGPKEDIFKP